MCHIIYLLIEKRCNNDVIKASSKILAVYSVKWLKCFIVLVKKNFVLRFCTVVCLHTPCSVANFYISRCSIHFWLQR
jgi:hypothetical protein